MAQLMKLLLLLVCVNRFAAASRGFLLMGPKVLMKDTEERFCAFVEHATGPANASLELMAVDADTVFTAKEFRLKGPNSCMELRIPRNVSEVAGRLRFRMRFDAHPDYVINSVKEVRLTEHEFIHVIQTDKSWYTPGQTVRFRLLSLHHLLRPVKTPIKRVWIEDPTGTTVAQWANVKTKDGLVQLEMPLSEEPVQGSWKIFMDRHGKTYQEFEVREYVLPRFEVNIEAPGYIESGLEKFSLNVCAKYTFGQPVRGNWHVNVTVENRPTHRYWWPRPESVELPIKLEDQGTLKPETGCFPVKISGKDLGFHTEDIVGKKVTVVAKVTEKDTDITINSTWSTEVKGNKLVVDMKKYSPDVFKLGLPYYGKVLVTTADGVPVANQTVFICYRISEKAKPVVDALPPSGGSGRENGGPEKCTGDITNSDGIAAFRIVPDNPKQTEYNFKISAGKAQKQFTAVSSYSKSGSFLMIAPPAEYPKPVSCSSKLPLKLYFTADGEMNISVHYLVISRGDVVSWGVRHVAFKEEDNVDIFSSGRDTESSRKKRNPEAKEDENEGTPVKNFIGDLEIDLEVTPELSPLFSVLAYYVREDGEVVTAGFEVPVQNCFPNPVKLSWSSSRRQPGSQAKLQLKAGSGSLCGYSVVDRSVTYMRPDLQLSERNILGKLPNFHIKKDALPSQTTPDWEYCLKTRGDKFFGDGELELRRKRAILPWYYRGSFKDAMQAFDDTGLLVMSDYKLETRPCRRPLYYGQPMALSRFSKFRMSSRSGAGDIDMPRMASSDTVVPPVAIAESASIDYSNVVDVSSAVKVRSYFPETWLWDLVTLDGNGEATVTAEVPHTITTWVGRAICVSESSGVGISAADQLEAFQPFFLEVHLPYSVKRGEKMQLKVSVFNYLPESIPVRVTLAYSEQLELLSESDSIQLCVPPKDSVIHKFSVRPAELGSVNVTVNAIIDESYPQPCGPQFLPSGQDTVVKPLLVKPEGFPMERVDSHLVCPKDFEEDKVLESDLSLPEDLVEGSARAWVTAIGDLMGPALQGLSGLVRMPTGCGEQNMVLFTPNIYVIEYLQSVDLLDSAVKSKAINFMKSGYQRELTYRHSDGSYSAFGKSDSSGSLWLTAFVVKSFAAAKKHIFIDEKDLHVSIKWLQKQQLENGCFPVVGKLFSSYIKGGLKSDEDDLAPLTAYTLISLLEAQSALKMNLSQQLVEGGLLCITPDPSEQQPNVYASSLAAYAFVLAGKTVEAREQINWLMQRAQNNNSLLWWEKKGEGASVSVEITSYVLLTLVKLGTNEDLLKARSIVRWLSRMRNSEGGFVSTQDTIVALQAIASYSSLIGAQPVNMELLLTAGDLEKSVRIQDENRLVQQWVALPSSPLPPSSLKIEAVGEGNGCSVVQSTLRYNVHTAPESSAFSLGVKSSTLGTGSETCSSKRLDICAHYLHRGKSNMALLEVSMVSGYSVVKSSLDELLTKGVKRYEEKDDTVVFYFDEIDQQGVCVSFTVWPAFEVNDAKEAVVRVYDYYQTEKAVSTSYILPTGCVMQQLPASIPVAEAGTTEVIASESVVGPASIVVAPEAVVGAAAVAVEPIVSSARNARQLISKDLDLEVPAGIGGQIPVIARPDQLPGCPVCVSKPPSDFNALFCNASRALRAETRADGRLKVVLDVSADKQQPVKVGSFVNVVLSSNCECEQLMQHNRTVIVLGLRDLPAAKPPVRVLVGPEVTVVDVGPKSNILRLARQSCASKKP